MRIGHRLPNKGDTMRIHTLRSIAEQAGREHYHARYVAERLGVKPIALAGGVGIYSDADADHIARELRRIEAERRAVAL